MLCLSTEDKAKPSPNCVLISGNCSTCDTFCYNRDTNVKERRVSLLKLLRDQTMNVENILMYLVFVDISFGYKINFISIKEQTHIKVNDII